MTTPARVNAPIFELRKGAERYCFQPLPDARAEAQRVCVWRPDEGALTVRDISIKGAREMWRNMRWAGWQRGPDGYGTPPYHHDFSRRGRRR